jgi:hypothetical protein
MEEVSLSPIPLSGITASLTQKLPSTQQRAYHNRQTKKH